MSSTNQGPGYFAAQKNYLVAKDLDDKLHWLEEMIRNFKKHKGSEKMLAELTTRRIKLKTKISKLAKSRKASGKRGIKKEGPQTAFIGFTNSGKTSILNILTNKNSLVANYQYTTRSPEVAMMDYHKVNIQIIDQAAVNHEDFDQGIANNADLLLIIITKFEDLEKIKSLIPRARGKKLIIYNKIDLLTNNEKRKLKAKLKTKKINYVLFSAKTKENLKKLRDKIFSELKIIRIYLKEPGKPKSPIPMIFQRKNITTKDVAEKIYKGITSNIREIRIWGPSSKFAAQKVGLKHKLKDLDVVEFKVR